MPRFNPIKTTVAEQRERENMKADIARNKAYNDYVAMMCGIEIPSNSHDMEENSHEG